VQAADENDEGGRGGRICECRWWRIREKSTTEQRRQELRWRVRVEGIVRRWGMGNRSLWSEEGLHSLEGGGGFLHEHFFFSSSL